VQVGDLLHRPDRVGDVDDGDRSSGIPCGAGQVFGELELAVCEYEDVLARADLQAARDHDRGVVRGRSVHQNLIVTRY
jgi:hypothetical protein